MARTLLTHAALVLVAIWLVRHSFVATANTSDESGSAWIENKYEYLSALVPFTNWFRFGDAAASGTMHAALWNGSAWDLHLSNRMAASAVLGLFLGQLVSAGSEGGGNAAATAETMRVLDAGCGWGGSTFFLEDRLQEALRQRTGDSQQRPPTVLYEGLTLAPTQARAANAMAKDRGISSRARFFVASYEEPLPSSEYNVVLAIESLEHTSNLTRTLAHFSKAMVTGARLVVLTDVLAHESERDEPTTRAYRRHWCGPHTGSWLPPAGLARWQASLRDAGLGLVSHQDLSPQLHHRAKWGLGAYFSVLLHVHAAASWAGLESLAFTLSTQIGGVARELLLHKDSISYSFMVARKE